MDPNDYKVNYNDERLTSIKNEQGQKENETKNMYDDMINNSNKFYQDQIDASKEWAQKQQEIQQANTDFAIDKINQEKEQTQKDYTKEQKASYTDYQKQVNDYGVNAEKMAAAGLSNTGYSETSKVSMYNTYQNRVATARESLNKAILQFDNSIKEAQLANNSKLAEITANALQQQLELSLQGFQYKNSLLESRQQQLNDISDRYNNRYQQMLNQINQEIEVRRNTEQYIEELKLKKAQLEEQRNQAQAELDFKKQEAAREQANWEKEYALSKTKTYSSINGSSELIIQDSDNTSENYSKYEKMVNTISSDLNTIYKNTSASFKEKAKNMISDKLSSAYNAKEISKSELKKLLDKMGIE